MQSIFESFEGQRVFTGNFLSGLSAPLSNDGLMTGIEPSRLSQIELQVSSQPMQGSSATLADVNQDKPITVGSFRSS